jgi:multidrug efflux pump subunit AcrA (membrane-fusion protein)
VPIDAIVDPTGSDPCVFRVESNRARRVPIQIVGVLDDRVLIEAELSDGERVVVAGHASLLDGSAVETTP